MIQKNKAGHKITLIGLLYDVTPFMTLRLGNSLNKNLNFQLQCCFWSQNASGLIKGQLQKIFKFSNFRQNFDIFCDTFPVRRESSCGSIDLILSVRESTFCLKCWFWSQNASGLINGQLQKIVKFSNFRQNFDIFCDTFPVRFESSRGPIKLILSMRQALT